MALMGLLHRLNQCMLPLDPSRSAQKDESKTLYPTKHYQANTTLLRSDRPLAKLLANLLPTAGSAMNFSLTMVADTDPLLGPLECIADFPRVHLWQSLTS